MTTAATATTTRTPRTQPSAAGRPEKRKSPPPPMTSTTSNNNDNNRHQALATAEIVERATLGLPGLSARDALTVWRALGLYVGDQLRRGRVLAIDAWGVLGPNDAGEAVFRHAPAFLEAHRLREALPRGLRGQPALAAAAPPQSRLQFVDVGRDYLHHCGPDVVRAVLARVVAFVGQQAKLGRALRLGLGPVGEWRVGCADSAAGSAAFHVHPEFQAEMLAAAAARDKERDRREHGQRPPVPTTTTTARAVETRPAAGPERLLTPRALDAHTTRAAAAAPAPARSRVPSSSSAATTVRSKTRPSTAASSSPVQKAAVDDVGDPGTTPAAAAVDRVRAKLIARCGDRGLNALRRVLALLDASGDGRLSPQELKFGLRDLGVELRPAELAAVVAFFDRDGDGHVSLPELLRGLRAGPLSARRRALVERAFALMDVAGRGRVSLDDLRDNYDVSLFPRVRAGTMTRAQALTEFLREWETNDDGDSSSNSRAGGGGGSGSGWITRAAFVEYYHNVSACIPSDSDFELLMRQAWHVSPETAAIDMTEDMAEGPEPQDDDDDDEDDAFPPPSTAKAPRASPDPAAAAAWSRLRALLLPTTPTTVDDLSRRLGANRVWGDGHETINTRAFANALGAIDRRLPAAEATRLAHVAAAACSDGIDGAGGDGSGGRPHAIALDRLHRALVGRNELVPAGPEAVGAKAAAPAAASGSATSAVLLERIRRRLLQRLRSDDGTRRQLSLQSLERTLRLMDTDGDRRLSKDELRLGLGKVGVDVHVHELERLFACLDADRSGLVDADEFLAAMRGELGARRLALIHAAFGRLDADGDGVVTLAELARRYDASRHPEVLAGRLSAAEALRQFARQWDAPPGDGDSGGAIVTRGDFERAYGNVSALIDSDDYFELLMRNAWHLSGGVGACANSSNRRVLVTRADGTEAIEEAPEEAGRGPQATAPKTQRRRQQQQESDLGARRNKHTGASDGRTPPGAGTAASARPGTSASSQSSRTSSKRPVVRPPSTPWAVDDEPRGTPLGPSEQQQLHERRRRREQAARRIQAQFRGFRGRRFAECVRRQVAAAAAARQRREAEAEAARPRVARAALKSYYGF